MRLLLVSTALAGAALASTVTIAATAKHNAHATPAQAKPAYGTYGIDTGGMDKAEHAGDDFYTYVNGTWDKTTAIPADKASYGLFEALQDLSRERTHALLETAAKDPGSKIGTAYAAYLDTQAINAKGLTPIQPLLGKIAGISSMADYVAVAVELDRDGIEVPFNIGVGQDTKDPEHYALFLNQGGLGLPDRDYYLGVNPKLDEALKAYQAYLVKLLTLAGQPDAEARAKALVDFETAVAKVSWTRIQNRDEDKTYNKMTLAELASAAPGFDFATYFKLNKTPVDTVIVGQPDAIAKIAALIAQTPLPVLKDQLMVRSLRGYASVLPKPFDDTNFAMYGTVISGTPQQSVRWKRATDYVSSILTDDVSRPYVAKYFPPATKAAIDQLVKNIIAAMGRRIDKLEWMAPATKARAHEKLAAFTPRLGYPNQWHDYSTLQIIPGDAFGNTLRARQWASDWDTQKLGKPIFRWEWGMTPMTVNAQANFELVAITFPAAILQPPYFDPKADPAVNYGAIGAVIGHEMSHHFDDQGAKFDLHGKLTPWWTDADVAAFKARTGKLVAQYDSYEPLPGMHIKGELTLGENAADLAGLNAALDAYHALLGGKPAPVIDGTTGDQRFFLAFAQVWRRLHREADLRNRLLTDPHAPAHQRVWEVRNMDAWYQAFNIQPGDKMYLAPADRVKIW